MYRCELNVDGVVEGQLALETLELLVVLAAPRLHHVLHVKHAWLAAVHHDHHTQIRQPGGPGRGCVFFFFQKVRDYSQTDWDQIKPDSRSV